MHHSTTQEKEYGRIKQTFLPPYTPVKINDAMLAFPAEVVGTMLPKWEDIPVDYRRGNTDWCHLVNEWFSNGLSPHLK